MNVQVNPEILRWARDTAGLEVEKAAQLLGFRDSQRRTAATRLRDLESGAEEPSFSVLDRMASKYRRPLLVFYLPHPPEDEEPAAQFRSAPKNLSSVEAGQLNAFVRNLRSRQELLHDALEEFGDSEHLAWVGSARENDGRDALASRLGRILSFDLKDYRSQRNADAGFRLLRERAEAAGAFVLLEGDFGSWQSALDTKLFRGLSLADSVAPFVVINPRDATSARSFTLLHEMAHLVLGQSQFANLATEDRLERLCNDVAGDLLLPEKDVRELAVLRHTDPDELEGRVAKFAKRWRVSSSLVAYRAARSGHLQRSELRQLLGRFEERWRNARKKEAEAAKQESGGPTYLPVRRYQLGASLVRRTRELWRAGELTTSRAGLVLGVRATSVHALLEPSRS